MKFAQQIRQLGADSAGVYRQKKRLHEERFLRSESLKNGIERAVLLQSDTLQN
jgi:hypothetical protein